MNKIALESRVIKTSCIKANSHPDIGTVVGFYKDQALVSWYEGDEFIQLIPLEELIPEVDGLRMLADAQTHADMLASEFAALQPTITEKVNKAADLLIEVYDLYKPYAKNVGAIKKDFKPIFDILNARYGWSASTVSCS